MKKVLDFLNKWGVMIILALLLFGGIRSCSMNKRIKKNEKASIERAEKMNGKIDSIKKYQITDVDLEIEGLKSEKRMIQSTDRKKFDLERENQIDKEIKNLEERRNR